MENVNKQLLDLVSSVLACEIEAAVFEQHVVPALNVARKVAAEQAQQAEPVAAQCRFEGEEWEYCTIAHHLLVQAHPKEWPHYETRALYAQPPAVAVPDAVLAMLGELAAYAPPSSSLCSPTALQGFAIRSASMLAAAQKGGE